MTSALIVSIDIITENGDECELIKIRNYKKK